MGRSRGLGHRSPERAEHRRLPPLPGDATMLGPLPTADLGIAEPYRRPALRESSNRLPDAPRRSWFASHNTLRKPPAAPLAFVIHITIEPAALAASVPRPCA